MRASLCRLLALVGVLALSLSVPASPAHAADEGRLTLVSLSGGSVTSTTSGGLAFTLTDTSPRAVEAVLVHEASGAIYRSRRDVSVIGEPRGTLSLGWSARWPGGSYRLDRVHVIARGTTSPSGPVTTYWADGRLTVDGVATGSHPLQLDHRITIEGEQSGELAPPSITAIALADRPAFAGDEIAVEVTVDDQQDTLAEVAALWADAAGRVVRPMATQVARGTVVLTAPAEAGVFEFRALTVKDQVSATTTYLRDGSVVHGSSTPEQSLALRGWTRPAPHSYDFGALDVSVAPAAPRLNLDLVRGRPGGAEMAWAHDDVETVSSWRLQAVPGGATVRLPAALPRHAAGWFTHTLSGLTNGTTHTVSVVAEGKAGDSRPVSVSVTPQMASSIVGLPRLSTSGTTVAATEASLLHQTPGTVRRYAVNGGRFRAPSVDPLPLMRIASGGNILRQGVPQVLGVTEGDLVIAHGYSNQVIGRGWAAMRWIDGGADFSGDGQTDVIAVDPAGNLKLYPTTAAATFGSSRTIGSGWGAFRTVFTPGDFDGDRRADVMAVGADGTLWLYRGNGLGGWLGKSKVGSGWASFGAVNAARDLNGDGFEDVLAVQLDGALKMYPGNGRGSWLAARTLGSGWQMYF